MKIAAISDIHGNLPALDAVLADIAAQRVDVVVNLGDILSGPLWAAATADRLMPLGLPTIAGNHERQLLTVARERMGASDRHAHDELRPEHRAWIGGLPATLALDDAVLCCHGTPDSDLVYWLETVTGGCAGPGRGDNGVRAASADEAAGRAGPRGTHKLILCGHTHVPRMLRLADGRLVVNPGSVGLQAYDDDHPHPHLIETGAPHARYALIDRVGVGVGDGDAAGWNVTLRAVAYDWESAARRADAEGRPAWAHALRTGRMGPLEAEVLR